MLMTNFQCSKNVILYYKGLHEFSKQCVIVTFILACSNIGSVYTFGINNYIIDNRIQLV